MLPAPAALRQFPHPRRLRRRTCLRSLALPLRDLRLGGHARACPPDDRSARAVLARITRADGSARFWQPGGGFDRNVRDYAELSREIEYIHHNPVRRGLVANPIDWPWSSARWYAGLRDGQIEIDPIRW